MRGVAFVILLVSFIGVANATPRWGDDFDWFGDTATNHQLTSLAHIGGDTILCLSYSSVWGLRQTGDSTFRELFSLQLPPLHMPRDSSIPVPIVVLPDIFYGYPSSRIRINHFAPPFYQGTLHHGFVFPHDSAFMSNSWSTAGDTVDLVSGSTPVRIPGSPHFHPCRYNDMILHGNCIYRLTASNQIEIIAAIPGVNDWAVRWPYAYGISLANNQLVTIDLSNFPPVETSRLPIVTAGFAQILRDTLITVQGPRWESWSLAAPSQPSSLGITQLPFHLFWIENSSPDSLYFGWGGHKSDYYPGWFTSYLFSVSPSVLTPRIVDSLWVGLDYNPPNPSQMTRTSFGWIGRLGVSPHNPNISRFIGIGRRWEEDRIRLYPLWTTSIESTFLNLDQFRGYTCTLRTDTTLWHPYDGANAFWDAFSYNPDNNRFTHLPAVPFRFRQVWNNMVYGDAKIGRWENNQWQVDSLKLRTGTPEIVSYDVVNFLDDRIIQRTWLTNTSANFRFYHLVSDSAFMESDFTMTTYGMIYFLRDSSFVSGISATPRTIGWYRKIGNNWILDESWTAIQDSIVNFTTTTKWDTLFLFGQKLYALPSTGSPYPVLDLAPLARVLPEPRQSNYQIDIAGNTVLVALPNSFCGVYYVSNDTAILRGTILKQGNQPNLIGNTAILTGRDGMSAYSIPPYNAVNDYFSASLPTVYEFSSPYPNPFNSLCLFHFTLPRTGNTGFTIYDLLGREVYKREMGSLQAGKYLASWNGRNTSGSLVGSGVYFLRFQSGNFSAVKKVVMVK